MITRIDSNHMGRSNLGWLNSWFHFSFADYHNPDNMNYSVLRVLNDDFILPGTGFDMHPHQDMEILTYVVEGELTHGDDMKNKRLLHRGDVQYMSAGTGVAHSEFNHGTDLLRMLQIWILPDRPRHKPHYEDFRFDAAGRINQWFPVVSGVDGNGPIRIHQNVRIFITELKQGRQLNYPLAEDRQAYLVLIEGNACICGVELNEKDAVKVAREPLAIVAYTDAHMMLFDLPAEQS